MPSHTDLGALRRAQLAAARLYLVCDAAPGGRELGDVLAAAIAGGVQIVQLRDKRLRDDELTAAARAAGELCRRLGALLIVNDRPAVALRAGADGVHVGQHDTPVADVRALVGADLLVGLSTHAPGEIDDAAGEIHDAPRETGATHGPGADLLVGLSTHAPGEIDDAAGEIHDAPRETRATRGPGAAAETGAGETGNQVARVAAGDNPRGVDYIGVGPVHATPTKPGRPPVGLQLVRYAAAHAGVPFFAIGGIDAENVASVIAAGGRRVAVVRAIADAQDPLGAARALRGALDV
jgi:thiamine-phosphate pyrophosphorylase